MVRGFLRSRGPRTVTVGRLLRTRDTSGHDGQGSSAFRGLSCVAPAPAPVPVPAPAMARVSAPAPAPGLARRPCAPPPAEVSRLSGTFRSVNLPCPRPRPEHCRAPPFTGRGRSRPAARRSDLDQDPPLEKPGNDARSRHSLVGCDGDRAGTRQNRCGPALEDGRAGKGRGVRRGGVCVATDERLGPVAAAFGRWSRSSRRGRVPALHRCTVTRDAHRAFTSPVHRLGGVERRPVEKLGPASAAGGVGTGKSPSAACGCALSRVFRRWGHDGSAVPRYGRSGRCSSPRQHLPPVRPQVEASCLRADRGGSPRGRRRLHTRPAGSTIAVSREP